MGALAPKKKKKKKKTKTTAIGSSAPPAGELTADSGADTSRVLILSGPPRISIM